MAETEDKRVTQSREITTEQSTAVNDQQRIADINNMYDAQKNNATAQLKTAYDQNMSDAVAARDKIPDQYQNSYNDLSSEYERQRRNNNLSAQANGLNTGASSQMNLAQTNAYLRSKSNLQASENEALNDANKNIVDLKTNYQNQIAQAAANADYQKTAALLDEYSQSYQRTLTKAQSMAEFGNFSGYAELYGPEQAQMMQQSWAASDPDMAYRAGVLSAEEYKEMTGNYPKGYSGSGGVGFSSGFFGPSGVVTT